MKFLSCTIVIILIFLFIKCTDKESNKSIQKEELKGKELGQLISEEYIKMNDELIEILKNETEHSTIKEKAEELKEKYIDIYFQYGKKREKLSEEEKKKCNYEVVLTFYDYDKEKFDYITQRTKEFWESDYPLATLITEFNIMTQYSDFELLKKQKPEEAKRLGIE
ncbi:MAG: hypothetical protein JW866_03455 [Ignavibacteriales bacterium]|nr:hypothetical protein [Ignavibacteriales bacterium]